MSMKIIMVQRNALAAAKKGEGFIYHAHIHKNNPSISAWGKSMSDAIIRLGENMKRIYGEN